MLGTAVGLFLVIVAAALMPVTDARFWVAGDLLIYKREYLDTTIVGFADFVLLGGREPLYAILVWTASNVGVPFATFVSASGAVLAAAYFWIARTALSSPLWALLATAIFVLSPLFDAFVTVALRQGLSLACILMGAIALSRGRAFSFIIWGMAALLLHFSALIFLTGLLIANSERLVPRRLLIGAMVVVAGLYASDISAMLAENAIQPVLAWSGYFASFGMAGSHYVTGFKLTFFAAALITCCVAIMRLWMLQGRQTIETSIARFALVVTMIFMLASGFAYHDRIASVSWIMAPILFMGVVVRLRFTRSQFWHRGSQHEGQGNPRRAARQSIISASASPARPQTWARYLPR